MTFIHFEFTYYPPDEDVRTVPASLDWPVDVVTFKEEARDALFAHMLKYVTSIGGICQLEKGTINGKYHVQGHGILQTPAATAAFVAKHNQNTQYRTMNIIPSVTAVVDAFRHKRINLEQMYAAKEDTRIDGPWLIQPKNVIKGKYIPRQQREVADEDLRQWQKWLIDMIKVWNTRHIHIIFDPNGNAGKSWLAQRLRVMSDLKVFSVAAVKDQERLEADMCSKLMKAQCTDPNGIFVDLPRAMPKENIPGIFAAIENIKGGYVNDSRNESHEWEFDCPNIFVFTNTWPDTSYLVKDRWQFHEITSNYEIIDRDLMYVELQVNLRKNAIKESKKRKANSD